MANVFFMRFGTGNPQSFTGLLPTFIIFNSATGTAVTPPAITESTPGSGLYTFNFTPSFPIAFIADGATASLPTASRYVAGQLSPLDMLDVNLAIQGTTLTAIGATNAAIGTTQAAQGVVLASFGATQSSQGADITAIGNLITAQGSTVIGIGSTVSAIGSTISGMAATLLASSSAGGGIATALGSTTSSFGTSSADPTDLFGYMKRVVEILEGNQTFDKSNGAYVLYDRTSGTTLRVKSVTNSTTGVTRS